MMNPRNKLVFSSELQGLNDMQLFCTPNSPYSRVARMAVRLLELDNKITVQMVTVRDPNSELLKYNPSGKVPTLKINDDLCISDTRMIVQKLEQLSSLPNLTADIGDSDALALEGLCLIFLESMSVWIREARRPNQLVSSAILELEDIRAQRCLDYLETKIAMIDGLDSLAALALAAALNVAHSRLGFDYHLQLPGIKKWNKSIQVIPAFEQSKPLPL